MPLRDYRCPDCGHAWEELRKGQTHQDTCPKCNKKNVMVILGAPAIHFKGSGFWTNDKHSYEPSKQVIIGPGGQVVNEYNVKKEWTPPGGKDNRNRD